MHFSFLLFGRQPELYPPFVQRAEKLGFEAVWFGDHVLYPMQIASKYPYEDSGKPPYRPDSALPDDWVLIAYLSALTNRIKLGTGVYVLPMRNPFFVAQSVATVQNLSRGRVIFGIGTGWLREEFEAVGAKFDDRGTRTDEMLDVMQKMWTGEVIEYHGRHYQCPPVRYGWAPETGIPLVFGGSARPALKRAAVRGDGWLGPTCTLEQSIQYRTQISGLREEAGRANRPFIYYAYLFGPITSDNVRRYEDAGFEHLNISPWAGLPRGLDASERMAVLDRTAETLAAGGYALA